MKILFHLVSGQNLPVYVATKELNPELNIYLYTAESTDSLGYLKATLAIQSDSIEIDAYNFDKIHSRVKDLTAKYSGAELILNVTNGTKIMAIALYKLFYDNSWKIYYVDTQNYQLIRLDKFESSKISCTLSPKAYIKLNGQNLVHNTEEYTLEFERALIDTASFLIKHHKLVKPFLLDFARKYVCPENENLIIYQPENSKFSTLKGSKIVYSNGCAELLIVKNGRALFSRKVKEPKFLNFLRGAWFELACYFKLKEIGLFDKIIMNSTIEWKHNYGSKSRAKNEIDIFAMKGIYPVVFECKSGNVLLDDNSVGKARIAINKLKTIKESYLGRYATPIFISPVTPRTKTKEVLSELGIRWILFENLTEINSILVESYPHLK